MEEFSKEEHRIFLLGQQAYNQALEHLLFPHLPDPDLIFDYSRQKGFQIDFQTYQIEMNLANTPGIYLDQEYLDYFFSLSLHELSHYVYCPFDTATNFRS